jgi:ribonuclease HII
VNIIKGRNEDVLMKSIAITDIKTELNQMFHGESDKNQTLVKTLKDQEVSLGLFVEKYKSDSRKGTVQLVNKVIKTIEAYKNELDRVAAMLIYENKYQNIDWIGGIDEAGRGPLAGPVVAACVILNKEDPILYVNDSKKLSHEKREMLYNEIIERSVTYGIGLVSHSDIDEMNILQATYKAMRLAIDQCKVTPQQLLNDAVIIPGVIIPQEKIIKGDAKSLSIAAASILAKVTRDRIMLAYDDLYPEYDFKSNKGYGSTKHIAAIQKYGATDIHRQSFIKNFI